MERHDISGGLDADALRLSSFLADAETGGGGSDSDFSDGIRRVIQPGEVLENRYLITRELESGASSRTFEAKVVGEGVQNSKLVSLKTVSLRDSSNWEVLDLFEEEARVLASLRHPAIPEFLEYFEVDTEEDRVFCLVQCLTPGQTLEASIESGWRPTEREAVRICEELLELLGYLQWEPTAREATPVQRALSGAVLASKPWHGGY
ncbi:hypothetical protein CYMTET_37548 [Cymbomonas tetramitiformis]|uniref:non-specific serine/threonine protein kinase n=1 Tax=Cymbomonas tetramitiformis TaxID=36881 RepID=A0AAE0CDQ2_9CHLO|nr:hypothetical protein CYMTET_37548 [Cymbomonas tetramitiformis]